MIKSFPGAAIHSKSTVSWCMVFGKPSRCVRDSATAPNPVARRDYTATHVNVVRRAKQIARWGRWSAIGLVGSLSRGPRPPEVGVIGGCFREMIGAKHPSCVIPD